MNKCGTLHLPEDLIKARHALSLLKIQKERGVTTVQRLQTNVKDNRSKPMQYEDSEPQFKETIDDRPIPKRIPKKPKESNMNKTEVKKVIDDDRENRPIKCNNLTKDDIEAQISSKVDSRGQCEYCDRMFNTDSLGKHQKVCQERPDKKKRKVFDSKKTRIIDQEQNTLTPKPKSKPKVEESKKPEKKIPKWKVQSEQFRNALRANTAVSGENEYQSPLGTAESSGYIKCPTCGRNFNEDAAKRHIPICANKTKSEAMKGTNQKKPGIRK